ncbi:Rhodanese-like protein [Daldinia caldariorum]|uniref:Rhodanese-like protein n=1 Tax=Daldinia caldariorum TaxID=326644 RepID=UPI0020087689|nr:Rhodanese-like protein [Daldinia caldariorum]KAI1470460.1 Rhodanese-like protein [Daldinia caldariorum]
MATRRFALNGAGAALRGSTSRLMGLRSGSSSASIPIATSHLLLRDSFGTTSRATRRRGCGTPPSALAPPQVLPRLAPRRSIRWSSSDSAAFGGQSKIWSFEQIQAATTSSSPKVTIIDVREPTELVATGRIPGALNVPIGSAPDSFHIPAAEFAARYGFERPPSADGAAGAGEVVFYCKAGVRSRAAAQIARDAGWKNVGEYPGSWLDWVAKGGKIER